MVASAVNHVEGFLNFPGSTAEFSREELVSSFKLVDPIGQFSVGSWQLAIRSLVDEFFCQG